VFDRIEFWGVRREKEQRAVSLLVEDIQFVFAVKGSIIHDNHSVFGQIWEQTLAKPPLKQAMFHCSVKYKRRYDFTP